MEGCGSRGKGGWWTEAETHIDLISMKNERQRTTGHTPRTARHAGWEPQQLTERGHPRLTLSHQAWQHHPFILGTQLISRFRTRAPVTETFTLARSSVFKPGKIEPRPFWCLTHTHDVHATSTLLIGVCPCMHLYVIFLFGSWKRNCSHAKASSIHE